MFEAGSPSRSRAITAGVVVVIAVASFSAGRFSAPAKVETRDVEKVVFKDKIVTVEKAAKVETKILWRDRIILKDGTVTEHEVEKTATKEDSTKNTDAALQGESTHETVKTVTLQPRWRVAVLAGGSWKPPLLPIAGPLVLGLEGDVRIIGGISAGLWANTGGAAGLSVALEF